MEIRKKEKKNCRLSVYRQNHPTTITQVLYWWCRSNGKWLPFNDKIYIFYLYHFLKHPIECERIRFGANGKKGERKKVAENVQPLITPSKNDNSAMKPYYNPTENEMTIDNSDNKWIENGITKIVPKNECRFNKTEIFFASGFLLFILMFSFDSIVEKLWRIYICMFILRSH